MDFHFLGNGCVHQTHRSVEHFLQTGQQQPSVGLFCFQGLGPGPQNRGNGFPSGFPLTTQRGTSAQKKDAFFCLLGFLGSPLEPFDMLRANLSVATSLDFAAGCPFDRVNSFWATPNKALPLGVFRSWKACREFRQLGGLSWKAPVVSTSFLVLPKNATPLRGDDP